MSQKYFNGDLSKLLSLIVLYITQGVSFGFFLSTLPIMMKKHFTYTQIGYLSTSTYPFNVKFLMSFIVDTKYIRSIGRRRTWIIPNQILAGMSMIYLAYRIDEYIAEGAIWTLTAWFTLIFGCLALQDIAVDGWALTIAKKENAQYAASSQSIGHSIGIFISTTLYLALSSLDF